MLFRSTELDELQAGEVRCGAGSSFQPQQQQRRHQGGVGHLLGNFDTENDGCVTIRDRDTMEQIRIPVKDVVAYINERLIF